VPDSHNYWHGKLSAQDGGLTEPDEIDCSRWTLTNNSARLPSVLLSMITQRWGGITG
jgi:hypothetical protein